MMLQFRLAVLAALTLFLTPALAFDVNVPGRTVPAGEIGVVHHDLVCDPPMVGVLLESGARLLLDGHLLDGCGVSVANPSPTDAQRIGVQGPGEIRNAGISFHAGTLFVTDLTITDAPLYGIQGGGDSNDGPSKVRLTNVTVIGSGFDGIRATKVRARDVITSGNGVTLPGSGIWAPGGVGGRGVVADGNANAGVVATSGRLRLRDSQITDNGCIGVAGVRVTAKDSTITGNDQSNLGCVDVVSGRPPRVRATTCGTSSDANFPATTWGVCSND